MYVHSLWSETGASFGELAEVASRILDVPTVMSERSAELTVLDQPDEVRDPEAQWKHVGSAEGSPGELLSVRLYDVASFVGIASVNSSLNFWLRERLAEYLTSRPLRLTRDLPWAARTPGWQLSAVHLQHAEAHTDVVVQGEPHNPAVLLREAGRLDDYDFAGMSLTDSSGRMVTLYDEGQIWLQEVGPNDVPDLIPVLLLLFGRD